MEVRTGCPSRWVKKGEMTNPDESGVKKKQDSEAVGGTARPIIFATLLREEGETGVQSHIGVFREYLTTRGKEVRVLTPFANPRPLVYPVFAVRRAIDPLCGPLSVWWYRYWHYHFCGWRSGGSWPTASRKRFTPSALSPQRRPWRREPACTKRLSWRFISMSPRRSNGPKKGRSGETDTFTNE